MVTNPVYRIPFSFTPGGVAVLEQDSGEEKVQSAEVVLRYERGQRTGLPKFGLEDQAMLQNGANLSAIVAAVAEQDERVEVTAEHDIARIRQGVDRVRVTLKARSNG